MRKLRSKWADDSPCKQEAIQEDEEVRAKVITSVKGKALKSKWAQEREDEILEPARIEASKNHIPKKTTGLRKIKTPNQKADDLRPTHQLSKAAKLFAERLDDKSKKDCKVIDKPAPSKYSKSSALKLGLRSEKFEASCKKSRDGSSSKTGNDIVKNTLENDETELSSEEKIRLEKIVQDLNNHNLNWADIDDDDYDVFT